MLPKALVLAFCTISASASIIGHQHMGHHHPSLQFAKRAGSDQERQFGSAGPLTSLSKSKRLQRRALHQKSQFCKAPTLTTSTTSAEAVASETGEPTTTTKATENATVDPTTTEETETTTTEPTTSSKPPKTTEAATTEEETTTKETKTKETTTSKPPKTTEEPTTTSTTKSKTSTKAPKPTDDDPPASGGTYSGQITFWSVAETACGGYHSPSEMVAAASSHMFADYPGFECDGGGNPNKNPLCGRKAKVNLRGKSTTVTIVDCCVGCGYGDLDLSITAFKKLASESEGRVSGMTWSLQ